VMSSKFLCVFSPVSFHQCYTITHLRSSLELIKPVVYDKSEENRDRRWAAQATLWVALEMSLRLLHPMMPFVTEELWQRLPGRGTLGLNETETIMLAKYPECDSSFVDDEAERLMSETLKVVRACRSLRASYHIPNKTLTSFFLKASTEAAYDATKQLDDIKTLGKASNVGINAPDVPKTVGTFIADEKVTVYMDVKGLIDFKVEIGRLDKNLKATVPQIEQLAKKMAAEGYEKVPEDVRKANEEKLESLQKKRMDLEEAIADFENLALLESS
jgi:valyl-tRNA synthetase